MNIEPQYDYRNRVYSATLGRFLQTDPIRFEAGDGNLYRYVKNNSARYSDPTGEQLGVGTTLGGLIGLGILYCIIDYEDDGSVNNSPYKKVRDNFKKLLSI
jgi:uncharacterized protein RhaS with RHS repeats